MPENGGRLTNMTTKNLDLARMGLHITTVALECIARGTTPAEALDTLLAGRTVSEVRRETLALAIELGASPEALEILIDARRVSRCDAIVLPPNRLEGMSRGRGWCRRGRGDGVVWGERVDGGYRVSPGRWVVGGHDGFSRKKSDTWDVEHVTVGSCTWTVAS